MDSPLSFGHTCGWVLQRSSNLHESGFLTSPLSPLTCSDLDKTLQLVNKAFGTIITAPRFYQPTMQIFNDVSLMTAHSYFLTVPLFQNVFCFRENERQVNTGCAGSQEETYCKQLQTHTHTW